MLVLVIVSQTTFSASKAVRVNGLGPSVNYLSENEEKATAEEIAKPTYKWKGSQPMGHASRTKRAWPEIRGP